MLWIHAGASAAENMTESCLEIKVTVVECEAQLERSDAMAVRFSVVMPVYNRKKYLRQAIDSVLSQTFTNFELIAVDDGSTDGSLEILKSYGNRIKFAQQPNQGPEAACNTAAAMAEGEYIWRLDSDDFIFPHAMAIHDQIVRTFDSPPLIIGMAWQFQDGQAIPEEEARACPAEVLECRDYLARIVQLGANSVVMRKSVFDQIGSYGTASTRNLPLDTRTLGPYSERTVVVNDDYNLLLKAGTYGPCIIVQKPCTFGYRMHDDNSLRNVKAIANGILLLANSERRGEYPGGSERRWDRYAVIGGRASNWALRYCWREGQRMFALRLLFGTFPMVAASIWKGLLRRFRTPVVPMVLPEEQFQEMSDAFASIPEGRKARSASASS